MGWSKWFFSMSGMILLVCALAIGGKGLNFGIDFESGTRIVAALEKPATVDQVREAVGPAGFARREDPDRRQPGARPERRADLRGGVGQDATRSRTRSTTQFGIAGDPEVSEIGPTFGESVANSAIVAIIASLLVISIYITLRFEWKFAVPVLIALAHDILITAGIYALVGQEVTTSTVAALLTILGFSLYDTIIVFDRIRENVPRMPSAAFSQIYNRSMSEVIVRSLATSFCTVLPVLALFLFGGETLQDFAFALIIGTLSGAYSSVFIAGPVLVHWKEREPIYRTPLPPDQGAARLRAGVRGGDGRRSRGRRADAAPPRRGVGHRAAGPDAGLARGLRRHGRQPRHRGRGRSRRKEPTGAAAGGRPAGGRRARARARAAAAAMPLRAPAPAGEGGGRAAGAGPGQAEEAAQPPAREASLMAALVWVMMGIAIWHFTIFIPDRFWAGIVGAFIGAVVGRAPARAGRCTGSPCRAATTRTCSPPLEAIPGALLGIAAVYFYGASQGNEPLDA